MGSKDAPQKMQFLGAIKKVVSLGAFIQTAIVAGKPPSPKKNTSESQCSCIFQEPMNRDKYAYMGLWVKDALGKSFCFSKIAPVSKKTGE